MVPFVKWMGRSTNVGMSNRRSPPGELWLAASVNSTLSALRPLYSAGGAVTVYNVASAGSSCRPYARGVCARLEGMATVRVVATARMSGRSPRFMVRFMTQDPLVSWFTCTGTMGLIPERPLNWVQVFRSPQLLARDMSNALHVFTRVPVAHRGSRGGQER